MENITIVINATVTDGTDLAKLRQRVANQLRNRLSNPVREDEGLTTVQSVKVLGSSNKGGFNFLKELLDL